MTSGKRPSEWTDARYRSFLRSAIRSAWNRFPSKWKVLEDACRPVTGKRHKKEYQCNLCFCWFKKTEVEVDHKLPAGGFQNPHEFGEWAYNILTLDVSNLQVLCVTCHKMKSKQDRESTKCQS